MNRNFQALLPLHQQAGRQQIRAAISSQSKNNRSCRQLCLLASYAASVFPQPGRQAERHLSGRADPACLRYTASASKDSASIFYIQPVPTSSGFPPGITRRADVEDGDRPDGLFWLNKENVVMRLGAAMRTISSRRNIQRHA